MIILALFLAAMVSIIGLLLCSVHIVELERRITAIERERFTAPYKLERPAR